MGPVTLSLSLISVLRWKGRDERTGEDAPRHPRESHFILNTIIEAGFDTKSLKDTNMTHMSTLLKYKGKDIQGQPCSIHHNIS
jgi:hypothetical protein